MTLAESSGKDTEMQDFIYKLNENGTYAVVGYSGDEAEVKIPDSYGGGIITVIGDKLFSGHKEIVSVDIPDTLPIWASSSLTAAIICAA